MGGVKRNIYNNYVISCYFQILVAVLLPMTDEPLYIASECSENQLESGSTPMPMTGFSNPVSASQFRNTGLDTSANRTFFAIFCIAHILMMTSCSYIFGLINGVSGHTLAYFHRATLSIRAGITYGRVKVNDYFSGFFTSLLIEGCLLVGAMVDD